MPAHLGAGNSFPFAVAGRTRFRNHTMAAFTRRATHGRPPPGEKKGAPPKRCAFLRTIGRKTPRGCES
jgi:hypothetical protein